MNKWIKQGNRVGIFLALLFVMCFAWYWLHPVHQELHMQILELSFFGYSGMNSVSFISGLIQSYIWGYIGTGLWYLSACCQKC